MAGDVDEWRAVGDEVVDEAQQAFKVSASAWRNDFETDEGLFRPIEVFDNAHMDSVFGSGCVAPLHRR